MDLRASVHKNTKPVGYYGTRGMVTVSNRYLLILTKFRNNSFIFC